MPVPQVKTGQGIYTGNGPGRPRGAKGFRRYMRMEQLARLEATGNYSVLQLAAFFQVTPVTIGLMKAQPEYQRIRDSFVSGVLDTLQDDTRLLFENQLAELKDLVPASLRTLRDTLVRGNSQTASIAERKMAMQAATEVFDREGTFAKVSKSEVHLKDDLNISEQQLVHDELSFLLETADAARAGNNQAAQALDAFVQAAGDKDSQVEMAKHINLEDFTVKPGSMTQ
jgi:hypothetical protein